MDLGTGLWWFACGEDRVRAGQAWLDPREEARLGRYRFTKRRTEYLLRRTAGKLAAAAALGLPTDTDADLARIAVLNARTGAPFVEVDGAPAGLELSLTDRAGQAIALVGADGGMASIGVDLEIVERRTAAFVADYCTAREGDWVREQALQRPDGFDWGANLLWSAKEAGLKVLRLGLREDTRRVDVAVLTGHRPDGWSRLTLDHPALVMSGWWRRDGDFLLTLASRSPCAPPTPLPGSADLTAATPAHSWLSAPLPRP